MKPIHYDITVYQNASWKLQATFKDPDGNPIDLSAHEGDFVVRRSVASSEALIRVDDASGNVELTNATENNVTVKLSRTETDELPTSNTDIDDWTYEFRIWETADPEHTTTRLMEGKFKVSPSTARPDNT